MVAIGWLSRRKLWSSSASCLPKSQRLIVEKCKTLAIDPFPGKGDKEIIQRKNHEDICRLHISRSYTAFYKVNKDEKRVLGILEIATIEQAHKIIRSILRKRPLTYSSPLLIHIPDDIFIAELRKLLVVLSHCHEVLRHIQSD